MGEKALVESQISDAVQLIKVLDANGAEPSFVVWYLYEDAMEWRLLIAGPIFDGLLPNHETQAYRKIVDAMSLLSLSALTLSDIKLIDSQSQLTKSIRLIIQTAPHGVVRAHFTDTTLNGIFIKEMVILRCV